MSTAEKWRIGKITIQKVVEFCSVTKAAYILPGATKKVCEKLDWLQPHYMTDKWDLLLSVHMLVIDIGGKRIAVDTCVGNCKKRSVKAWNNRNSDFLKDLTALGYPPDTFTHVVITHMHDDHVGWNTTLNTATGEWVPTFPNARYLIVDKEYQYWRNEYEPRDAGPMTRAMDDMELLRDSIQPIMDHCQLDLVPDTHEVASCEGGSVHLHPTPGHTPGHVSVVVRSGSQRAFITGDAFHNPVQVAVPSISATHVDFDSKQAIATRSSLLPFLASPDLLVIGTHFATPSAGRVVRSGGGYIFTPCGTPCGNKL